MGRDGVDYDFASELKKHSLDLRPLSVETLQVNLTKLCNQACRHCHVDASPKRTESMDRRTLDRCLSVLASHSAIRTLDITGGAPELHPDFEYFVEEAVRLRKRVRVRHNLTVTLDGHPTDGSTRRGLPQFFASQGVEVVSSLPFYEPYFTDKQRGTGVFQKSIESLKLLNAVGYGRANSGLILDLVYNPVGAFVPPAQTGLERDFKTRLFDGHGIEFNRLFTITNMPIHRFREQLERTRMYDEYMEKLASSFNPGAAEGVMCRTLVSVAYDGTLYDCDFHQMADLPIERAEQRQTIFDFEESRLVDRGIRFADHCFGCTAGAGSSCGGAIAESK